MNIATATPAEIDTEINRLNGEIAAIDAAAADAMETIRRFDEAGDDVYAYYRPAKRQQLEAARDAKREQAVATLKAAPGKIDALVAERHPLKARYNAEQWNRYYLVDNTGGHVHTSKSCRTCYDTTVFVWLTEYSGMPREELTELAGALSCAECFPNLPAHIMRQKTRIESPAKRKTREEREAKKAAATAKKLEKALLPDGSILKVSLGFREQVNHRKGIYEQVEQFEKFETLHSARGWLTDAYWWGVSTHPSFPESAVKTVAEAVATKEGKDVETVLAEAKTRAAKRK